MTACPECHGAGEVERTIGGSGEPEADVFSPCSECLGLGTLEARDMLACLMAVWQANTVARSLGEPGLMLRPDIRDRIATVLASLPYASVRWAETHARSEAVK